MAVQISGNDITVPRDTTVTRNLTVGGVLTYEDVTNVDSVGVITARTDINLGDSIIHNGDDNTKIRFPSTDTITAETASYERLRINSSGQTMIGTTTPTSNQAAQALTIALQNNGNTGITLRSGTGGGDLNEGSIFFSDATSGTGEYSGYLQYSHANDYFRLGVNSVERLRIASDGKGFFNTTSAVSGNNAMFQVRGGISVDDGTHYRYIYQSANGHVYFSNGSNQAYLSSSGTWTDASDINIKKDITDLSYGINSLKNLKPRKFKMKSDDTEQIGFIAQEVESIIPEVVDTGNLPDGTEQKGLTDGHLTAVLTKALQEAVAKIETLEAKVDALEGS